MNRKRIVNADELPELEGLEVVGSDMAGDYWSPSEVGEVRRFYYGGIEFRPVADFNDASKTVELECVLLIEPGDPPRTWVNGAKRLVAIFRENDIEPGKAFQIVYMGRAANRTNSNSSDRWDVREIKIPPPAERIEEKPEQDPIPKGKGKAAGKAKQPVRAAKKKRGRPRKAATK